MAHRVFGFLFSNLHSLLTKSAKPRPASQHQGFSRRNLADTGCIFLPQSARLRLGAPDLKSSHQTTRHSTRPPSHHTLVSCLFSRRRFVSASQDQPLRVFVCPRLWKRVRHSFFCRLPFQGSVNLRPFTFTAHSLPTISLSHFRRRRWSSSQRHRDHRGFFLRARQRNFVPLTTKTGLGVLPQTTHIVYHPHPSIIGIPAVSLGLRIILP